MGLYLRKSVRVGPLRFNLSKGGVRVSAGIKGFRVGTGPRGNYVHMGAGGIYYRATITSGSPRPHPASSNARVFDRKYHAGAGTVVERKPTRFVSAPPPFVQTNIQTIAVNVGTQTLHFFPDRVLIYDANGVGAVSYQGLQVLVSSTRFIEDGGVPRDALVVDRTWRYVNKKGGPDRRFKDNREIPVCQYEELALRSDTGLNELLQISRIGSAAGFASAITTLCRIMPKEVP